MLQYTVVHITLQQSTRSYTQTTAMTHADLQQNPAQLLCRDKASMETEWYAVWQMRSAKLLECLCIKA